MLTLSTHSQRLERWLGAETVAKVSNDMRDWYGPPIALHGVPGAVYARGGGDFVGEIRGGWEATAFDRARDLMKRLQRAARIATGPEARSQLNTGFGSLSALINSATQGKRYEFQFQKVGPTGVANVTSTLWRLGNQPAAGTTPSAAPGGNATTSATVGAFSYTNPTGGDTLSFVAGFPMGTVAGNTLLLYDRIFHVAKTMNSNATEAVTGVPTRYQNQTGGSGNPDYIGGNFLFVEVGGTALAATAHNWTVCQYTNQGGTAGQAVPSLTGNSAAIIDRLDHPVNQWFAPLASGDTGIKALTQMQCSAAVATGLINFVMGHPIAWMPCPIATLVCTVDGINSAFNLARIFDNACLAFLEVVKPSTTATTYTGSFTAVAG